jgi:hypothetical protein
MSGLLFFLPARLRVAVSNRGAGCLFRVCCLAALSPARLRVSVGCALPRFLALSVCLRVARLSRGLPGPGADLPRVGRVRQGRPVCRTGVRGGGQARGAGFEQVFEKKSATFSAFFCQNFQPNPDRISNRILTESQPNLDRISESLWLTFEPNPNRISRSVKDFILLAACSLGVRCRIYVLALVDC